MGEDQTIQSRRTFSVGCSIATDTWAIENNFMDGTEEVWMFDQTNVFHSIRLTEEMAPQSPEKQKLKIISAAKNNTNTVTVYVEKAFEGHPLGNVGVNIPWLAFCSADYLSRPGRLIPIPVATLRKAAEGFAYKDKTSCFDDGHGLPNAIDLLASMSLLQQSINLPHFDGMRDMAAYLRNRPAFQDGAVKFHYAVTKKTNFLGRTFPLEFSWFQNESTQDGKWVRRYSGSGKTTSVGIGMISTIFHTNMENVVVDYRLLVPGQTNVPLVYASTDMALKPTNDAKLQALLKEKSIKLSATPVYQVSLPVKNDSPARAALRWTIVSISVLSLVALARKHQTNN